MMFPARFRESLDKVYATAHSAPLSLDGQNVFIYFDRPDGTTDCDFGVGVNTPFEAIGDVRCIESPSGTVATTTHWGDYRLLRQGHMAIREWCRTNGHADTGLRWEAYGHWHEDPVRNRTDIFYLLKNG